MNNNEILTVVITTSIGILFIVLGILMRTEKLDSWVNGGTFMWFLWRKYNTYNIPAVTKLLGIMFLAIAALVFVTGLSSIFNMEWLTITFVVLMIAVFVTCMVIQTKIISLKTPLKVPK